MIKDFRLVFGQPVMREVAFDGIQIGDRAGEVEASRIKLNACCGVESAIQAFRVSESSDFNSFTYATAGGEIEMDIGSSIKG